ncbi:MAG: methyltransferase, partial [Planktomarina sp.]
MALEAGLAVPDDARWLVMYPAVDFDFGGVRSTVIQPHFPSYEALTAAGHDVQTIQPEDRYDVAVVCVTRSKAHTRDLIARAASLADLVIVDGQKTDGIESHYKAVRGRADVAGTLTKAHGRMFWFKSMDLEDWHCGPSQVEGGFQTLPGVFSTDAPDPGSALLADALPEVLGKTVADLGAGWGYLSRHILERASVEALHLVEADQRALDCAQI